MPQRTLFLLSLFLVVFGALIIVRCIESVMNPIAHLGLAPLMLFPAGGLLIYLGYYLTKKFGE